MSRAIDLGLRDAMVEAARDLDAGLNPEYLRGQVELIIMVTGDPEWDGDLGNDVLRGELTDRITGKV